MEPIEVIAHFDREGKIVPRSFAWQRRTFRVDSIGRRWNGRDGLHIMVMTPRNRAHHLLFDTAKGIWYLVRGSDVPTIPLV
ncbi:MAG: hypothetical protein HN413_15725 [Chloroflexi bacterium]|nr:hypothetical protein [Chloroflexota bacterium]